MQSGGFWHPYMIPDTTAREICIGFVGTGLTGVLLLFGIVIVALREFGKSRRDREAAKDLQDAHGIP